MNSLTYLYQLDGKPMLTPDGDVQMQFTDLDSGESGRDEAGFMHRIVVRRKVASWSFLYSSLTQKEYVYMQSILPRDSFLFTYPDPEDPAKCKTTRAYLSQYGISWHNARTGEYRNLKFEIIEC